MKKVYMISAIALLIGTMYSGVLSAQPQGLLNGGYLYGLDQTGFVENGFKLDSIHIVDSSDKSTSRMTLKYGSTGNFSELCIFDQGIIQESIFYYSDMGRLLKQDINLYYENSEKYTVSGEPSEYDDFTGRPLTTTFYQKVIKSNGTMELRPIMKYEVEGYNNNHPESLATYQFYDGDWVPSSLSIFSYDKRGLLIQELSTDVEVNEGTIRYIATVVLKDYEYDRKGNMIKESTQEGVVIYYADGTQKEMTGESYVCTYNNGYDENGLLMYQIEYDNDGIEEGTLYYYWSKLEGSSVEPLSIYPSSEDTPYYELDGRPITENALQPGRIYIHNGRKTLIR